MAEGRVVFEVVVEGKNVKVVQRQVEGVTDAVNDNTNAQGRNSRAARQNADAARAAGDAHNHFDRGLKGSGGSSSNATKNFSKMRDSMSGSSGLVGAYATLAANLFAATAAFAALQRAAQVEQLTQGLVSLGRASGVAMISLSKGLQEATGYSVSLQDSMRSVALVTSSGFDTSYVERLGKVAKNTSVALGRDMQDSMNRLVKGATKLEPELLDELGIMVRIDEATQKYALSMGKSAGQLTNFEKRQAFMNAILEEGEKKFGAIGDSVSANSYDKLSASLQELGTSFLGFLNTVLGPLAGYLAENKLVLAGFIAILTKGILNQAIPALSALTQAAANAAVASSAAISKEVQAQAAEVEALKTSLPSLSALGKKGEAMGAVVEQAASLDELSKANSTFSKSLSARVALETKTAGSQTEQIAQLKAYLLVLNEVIQAEAKRLALEKGGGTIATNKRTDFLTGGAAILEKFDANPTIKNYMASMKEAWAEGSEFRKGMFELDPTELFGDNTKDLKDKISGIFGDSKIGAGLIKGVDGIGAGFSKAAVFVESFGLVGRLAIKGIVGAIPIIGQLLVWGPMLLDIFKGIWNYFKSDSQKQFESTLEKVNDTMKELVVNSEEVNKALAGTSTTITNLTLLTEAQSNIVSQVSKNYTDLVAAAKAAGSAGDEYNDSAGIIIETLDGQINANYKLQESFKTQYGGYKTLTEYADKKNISEEEAVKIGSTFITSEDKKQKSLLAVGKAFKETNTIFSAYINSLSSSTPFSTLVDSIEESLIALNTSQDKLEGTRLALENLSDAELRYLGLLKERAAVEQANSAATTFKGAASSISEPVDILQSQEARKKINAARKMAGMEEIGYTESTNDLEDARLETLTQILKLQGLAAGRADNITSSTNIILNAESAKLAILEKSNLLEKESQDLLNKENRILQAQGNYKTNQLSVDMATLNNYTSKETSLQNQIKAQETYLKTQGLSVQQIARAKNKQKELEDNLFATTYERIMFENTQGSRNAQAAYSQLQEAQSGEQEILNILQKQLAARREIFSAQESLLESQVKIANLRAGGTGEVSASAQLDNFMELEKDRKANIESEKAIKLRLISMEEKLNNARLAILRATIAEYLARKDNAVTGETKIIGENRAALEAAAEQLKNLNYGEAANLERRAAILNSQKDLSAAEATQLELTYRAKKAAASASQELAQTSLDLVKTITDLDDKVVNSRRAILDGERTIIENQLKATNYRNQSIGSYELTAQQTLELEINFGEQKRRLIEQEAASKEKTIKAEYALLKAQLILQEFEMRSTLVTLSTRKGLTEEQKTTVKNLGDSLPQIFAEASRIMDTSLVASLEEAAIAAKAASSEITAAQIQAFNAVYGWTTKMQTSWKDISGALGQNFIKTLQDAKSITQELADAFTNSVNAAVDGFVDAIVEGKNAFKAIGDALRNSLRDSFAEAAKNKLKEGIAGIFTSMKMEGVAEFLQSPEDKAAAAAVAGATAAQATTEAVASHTSILQQIADNTARCCTGSMPAGATPPAVDYGVTGGMSPAAPKKVIKLTERQIGAADQTTEAATKTAGNVSLWGKLQEAATENVGTIAATGFASMAAALAAGASPKKALLGGILGAVGAAVGMAYGGPAGAAAGQQMAGMGAAKAGFAKGGVMSSSGSMPLHKYGRGGVARTPQLAMFGEGSKPEAYVPLQDGRSIPVTMAGGSGNVNNISVNVAVDNKGGTQTQTQAGGKDNSEEQARMLGTAISNAVKQEMMNQQRPGGLLYKGRR